MSERQFCPTMALLGLNLDAGGICDARRLISGSRRRVLILVSIAEIVLRVRSAMTISSSGAVAGPFAHAVDRAFHLAEPRRDSGQTNWRRARPRSSWQ